MNNKQRWEEKYRGAVWAGFDKYKVPDSTFRSLVDMLCAQVFDGRIDLDEVEGAAYMVSEIVKDRQRRFPDWKPKTAEERKADLESQLRMAMLSNAQILFHIEEPGNG